MRISDNKFDLFKLNKSLFKTTNYMLYRYRSVILLINFLNDFYEFFNFKY